MVYSMLFLWWLMVYSVLYHCYHVVDDEVCSLSCLGDCICCDFWGVKGFGFHVPHSVMQPLRGCE